MARKEQKDKKNTHFDEQLPPNYIFVENVRVRKEELILKLKDGLIILISQLVKTC
jgi:hypothetical protein